MFVNPYIKPPTSRHILVLATLMVLSQHLEQLNHGDLMSIPKHFARLNSDRNQRQFNDNLRPMTASVPASIAEIDATEECQTLIDNDTLLMMRPQLYSIRMSHHLSHSKTQGLIDNILHALNLRITRKNQAKKILRKNAFCRK